MNERIHATVTIPTQVAQPCTRIYGNQHRMTGRALHKRRSTDLDGMLPPVDARLPKDLEEHRPARHERVQHAHDDDCRQRKDGRWFGVARDEGSVRGCGGDDGSGVGVDDGAAEGVEDDFQGGAEVERLVRGEKGF